jgi:hypothetical protein
MAQDTRQSLYAATSRSAANVSALRARRRYRQARIVARRSAATLGSCGNLMRIGKRSLRSGGSLAGRPDGPIKNCSRRLRL